MYARVRYTHGFLDLLRELHAILSRAANATIFSCLFVRDAVACARRFFIVSLRGFCAKGRNSRWSYVHLCNLDEIDDSVAFVPRSPRSSLSLLLSYSSLPSHFFFILFPRPLLESPPRFSFAATYFSLGPLFLSFFLISTISFRSASFSPFFLPVFSPYSPSSLLFVFSFLFFFFFAASTSTSHGTLIVSAAGIVK